MSSVKGEINMTLDCWECSCGNNCNKSGFFASDFDGNEVEPLEGSEWDYTYVCGSCGVVNQDVIAVKDLE